MSGSPKDTPEPRAPTAARLLGLHEEVGRDATALAQVHAARLQCARGCSACCIDGLTVFEVEAERIRANHRRLLSQGRAHAAGACAFLDDSGACRIYSDRPYVCRTQGLPLRWVDGEQEYRDICPLNDTADTPLQALDPGDCWTLGPVEGRLATLEAERAGGSPVRVALRDLFTR